MQSNNSSHTVIWQVRTQWTVQKDLYVFLWLLNCLFYSNSIIHELAPRSLWLFLGIQGKSDARKPSWGLTFGLCCFQSSFQLLSMACVTCSGTSCQLFFIERELQWCYHSPSIFLASSQTAPCPLSSFDTHASWQPVTLDLDDLTGK